AGSFTLQVNTSVPPPLVPHDECRGALTVEFDPGAELAVVHGSTLAAGHEMTGACGTHTGPDVVYRVSLPDRSRVVANVVREGASSYKPAVYLATGCDSTSGQVTGEFACANDSSGTARAVAKDVGPGEVFIVVDGAAGTAGDFKLEVT